jgi:hypothetical protein
MGCTLAGGAVADHWHCCRQVAAPKSHPACSLVADWRIMRPRLAGPSIGLPVLTYHDWFVEFEAACPAVRAAAAAEETSVCQ